jgi:chromosome segregation ATPase
VQEFASRATRAKAQLSRAFELQSSLAAPLTQLQQQVQAAADDIAGLEAHMGSTPGAADLKMVEAALAQAEAGLAAVDARRTQLMATKEEVAEHRCAIREQCALLPTP